MDENNGCAAHALLGRILACLPENVWVQILRKKDDDHDIAWATGTGVEHMKVMLIEAGIVHEHEIQYCCTCNIDTSIAAVGPAI